ncbi:MAG: ABC-F family ATP-binding cassette domain-containing protein, partial [Sediminibacterium sp.]|nr:ABC-F family ATP-binding cassette domain-containing protein [Sediminibacterium sp.]
MHILSAENLSLSYTEKPLFKNINFNINEGDKIGLIARNGVGKTSLLNLLANKEEPNSGKIWLNKEAVIIFLQQEPSFEEEKSVLENIFLIDNPIFNALRDYEHAQLLHDENKITAAIEKIENLHIWHIESIIHQILTKLKISDIDKPVKLLSGGQRKRVSLAKVLIESKLENRYPMLLLDEPTNHLDFDMIEWLEAYLKKEKITLILVTHDRYFLDDIANKIWELQESNMYFYGAGYENYIESKLLREESEISSIDKAKNQYRIELEWMRKQPKARTTKSKSRQENYYKIEAAASKKIIDTNIQLEVKMTRLGGKILEIKKVYKSFENKVILKGFDYTFSQGERMGIIGNNGVGKSTFIKILQQQELPDSGKINVGETIRFGYYNQDGLIFKENIRVIEYVKNIAENFQLKDGSYLSAGQFLELFLFPPEKQFTFLDSLSGGEKKRLLLLSILFKNPNFLILDEPTNDLDIPTLQV